MLEGRCMLQVNDVFVVGPGVQQAPAPGVYVVEPIANQPHNRVVVREVSAQATHCAGYYGPWGSGVGTLSMGGVVGWLEIVHGPRPPGEEFYGGKTLIFHAPSHRDSPEVHHGRFARLVAATSGLVVQGSWQVATACWLAAHAYLDVTKTPRPRKKPPRKKKSTAPKRKKV